MERKNATSEELKKREALIHEVMPKAFALVDEVMSYEGLNASKVTGEYKALYDTLNRYSDTEIRYELAPKSLELTGQNFTFNQHGDVIKESFKQFFDLVGKEELLERPGVFEKLGPIKKYEGVIEKLFDLDLPLSQQNNKGNSIA